MVQVTPRASIPYPDLTDVPNAQTAFQNMLTAIDTQMMPRYATVAALPSAAAGQLAYVTAEDGVYQNTNGATIWSFVPRTTYYVKPSDTSRTLNTAVTSDPFFVIPLRAGKRYEFDCHYFIYADQGVDFKCAWSLPAGTTATASHFAPDIAITNINGSTIQYSAFSPTSTASWGIASGAAVNPQYVKQSIQMTTTTAGNAIFQWAQVVSSAIATTLAMDSFIKVTRLS